MRIFFSLLVVSALSVACAPEESSSEIESSTSEINGNARGPRYAQIRDAAVGRGVSNGYLLAGIAMTETNLAHCWSEATWACKGPGSPDCGGGPVIAGASDGPCSIEQGGLGMFQFDAGTFRETLGRYGSNVLTIDGQIGHAVDYVTRMVRDSAYTTDAETDEKARAWINRFDLNNGALRDQWIRTVLRYYNGCQEGWSCWNPRYRTYSDGLSQVLADTGGPGFWNAGTRCPGGKGTTIGAIDAKYRALGACGSVLGAPVTDEVGTPDRIGRYSVFERGSIYWTARLGAHEVHGVIRDKWKELDWEPGVVGYPVSDEIQTPDKIGRYNVFERGSIYWTEATGAHEVLGRIRDKWKELGWEAGELGYPIAGEVDVEGGRMSEFQHGSITWVKKTDELKVTLKPKTKKKESY